MIDDDEADAEIFGFTKWHVLALTQLMDHGTSCYTDSVVYAWNNVGRREWSQILVLRGEEDALDDACDMFADQLVKEGLATICTDSETREWLEITDEGRKALKDRGTDVEIALRFSEQLQTLLLNIAPQK